MMLWRNVEIIHALIRIQNAVAYRGSWTHCMLCGRISNQVTAKYDRTMIIAIWTGVPIAAMMISSHWVSVSPAFDSSQRTSHPGKEGDRDPKENGKRCKKVIQSES